MVPMGVATSVATTVRPRARLPALVSMPHASRRALTTCRPCMCAGAEFFETFTIGVYYTLPAIVADAYSTRKAAEAAWRLLRVPTNDLHRAPRACYCTITASVCKRCQRPPVATIGPWWPVPVLWVVIQPIWAMVVIIWEPYGSRLETYFQRTLRM